MPKLTEDLVQEILATTVVPRGAKDVTVWDDVQPGFYVRLFRSGKATYGVKYRVAGRQARLSLGPVVPKQLAERRKMAGDVVAKARLGQDVQAEKREAAARLKAEKAEAARKAAEPPPVTLGDVAKIYLAARKSEMRPRSYVEVERHISKRWKSLHHRPIAAITRAEVVAALDTIEALGKVEADHARSSLNTLFCWAIDRGYVDASPMLHIKARADGKSRERVLTEAELVEVWKACDATPEAEPGLAPLSDNYGRIVRLLILTGQRRGEIGDLAWSEIDLDHRRQIELPPPRTKNGRPHIVPLSDAAIAILRRVTAIEGEDMVFGRWRKRKAAEDRRAGGAGGFAGWGKPKAALDARILALRRRTDPKAKAMPHWTLHDLRRSFVTHMNERKLAQPHVVEAIVNHVSGHLAGVAGVYNKAQYLEERREALQRWADHIAALVEGRRGNVVVTIRKRA